jgi:hypothetical protein
MKKPTPIRMSRRWASKTTSIIQKLRRQGMAKKALLGGRLQRMLVGACYRMLLLPPTPTRRQLGWFETVTYLFLYLQL